MARTNNLTNFLTDVAEAIKTKKGSETDIPASSFDTEILNLPSQGTYQEKSVTISANGTTTVTPDTGYDAMTEVEVTTQVPEKQLQTKNYEFTQNATLELNPDTGYDGFNKVGLTINVSGGSQDPTTAAADDVFSPKTFYSNGQKLVGTNVVTYTSSSSLLNYDFTMGETINNPIPLIVDDESKLVIIGSDSVPNVYLCDVDYTERSLTIKSKVSLSSLNSAISSVPVRQNISLSKIVNAQGDYYLYIGYGSYVYLIKINFENNTVQYVTSVSIGYTVKELVCNPVYPNKCYLGCYINNYVHYGRTVTYNGTSLAVSAWSSATLNIGAASNSYQMHISSDGSVLSIAGQYVSGEQAYDPYLVLLFEGDYRAYTQITPRSGGDGYGINPSGTICYAYDKIYSITKTVTSISVTQIGTMSVSGKSATFGLDFINDSTMVVCDSSTAYVYSLDANGLNPTLLNAIGCKSPAVTNNAHVGNHSFFGEATGIRYAGFATTNYLETLTAANGVKLYNTSTADATPADVMVGKTAFNSNGSFIGTMPDIEPDVETAEDYTKAILRHKPIYPTIRELEYIQSTGTQYINTGVLANANLTIEISFKCTATSPNYMRLWGISGATTAEAMMNNVTNTEWAFDGFSTNYTIDATSSFRVLKYVRSTMTTVYLDGSTLGTFATKSDTNKNLWLFRGNDRYSNYYLAYCKISTSNILIRDFIPAKRKSDGAIGLYDKVNETFYVNSGTGSFVAGPDALR